MGSYKLFKTKYVITKEIFAERLQHNCHKQGNSDFYLEEVWRLQTPMTVASAERGEGRISCEIILLLHDIFLWRPVHFPVQYKLQLCIWSIMHWLRGLQVHRSKFEIIKPRIPPPAANLRINRSEDDSETKVALTLWCKIYFLKSIVYSAS